jgi:hypothetical protein
MYIARQLLDHLQERRVITPTRRGRLIGDEALPVPTFGVGALAIWVPTELRRTARERPVCRGHLEECMSIRRQVQRA